MLQQMSMLALVNIQRS